MTIDTRPAGEAIGVRVMYLEGCDATPRTVQLVQDVAAALGVRICLEQVAVTTEDEAAQLRFLGSPTVHVNGLDIDVEARSNREFGLT